jgi:hypothetical protein
MHFRSWQIFIARNGGALHPASARPVAVSSDFLGASGVVRGF